MITLSEAQMHAWILNIISTEHYYSTKLLNLFAQKVFINFK